jgi:hypothetical protein
MPNKMRITDLPFDYLHFQSLLHDVPRMYIERGHEMKFLRGNVGIGNRLAKLSVVGGLFERNSAARMVAQFEEIFHFQFDNYEIETTFDDERFQLTSEFGANHPC